MKINLANCWQAILDGQINNDYEAGFQQMLKEGAKMGLKVVGA